MADVVDWGLPSHELRKHLLRLHKSKLIKACKYQNISSDGNKNGIIDRLLNANKNSKSSQSKTKKSTKKRKNSKAQKDNQKGSNRDGSKMNIKSKESQSMPSISHYNKHQNKYNKKNLDKQQIKMQSNYIEQDKDELIIPKNWGSLEMTKKENGIQVNAPNDLENDLNDMILSFSMKELKDLKSTLIDAKDTHIHKQQSLTIVPLEIVLHIISFVETDDLAFFSLTSKAIREYTKEYKIINISQIIYRYSRKDFLSILKILRFHPFREWLLPSNYFLYDSETTNLIINMMQHWTAKSIIFEPLLIKYHSWLLNNELLTNNKFIQSLSYLQLNHIQIKAENITIPSAVLKPSQQTLISIYSSYKAIYNFLYETTCFDNLQTLSIQYNTINDFPLIPYNVFGHSTASKFGKLKHLTLKKQCITESFHNILLIIASLPILTHFVMEYCKFNYSNINKNEIPFKTMDISLL